jgi:hypothetical protein
MGLEASGLFDMKLLEVAKSGISKRRSALAMPSMDASFRPLASLSQLKYSRLIRSFGALYLIIGSGPLPKSQFREGRSLSLKSVRRADRHELGSGSINGHENGDIGFPPQRMSNSEALSENYTIRDRLARFIDPKTAARPEWL